MSHNSYTRTSWTSGTALFAAEMASLDAKTFKAINGDEGGTWAPSSVITVGGSGLTLKLVGASTAEGFFVNGTLDSAFGSNAYFRGSTAFRDGSTTTVRDGATWTFNSGSQTTFDAGSFLNVNGTVAFTGTFTAEFLGVTTIQVAESIYAADDSSTSLGNVSIRQASNLLGNLTTHGVNTFVGQTNATIIECENISISSTSSIAGAMSATGAGRLVKRYTFISSTGANSSTHGPVNTDRVIVNDLTADVIFTINNSDVKEGDEIVFVNKDTSFRMSVSDPSNGVLINLKQASGFDNSATFYYHSGSWEVLTRNRVP